MGMHQIKNCLTCGYDNQEMFPLCDSPQSCEKFSEWIEKENIKKDDTQEKIELLFNNFKQFLKEKNKRYGDSALHPLQIFSKQNANSQICNRLDDKLGRIKNAKELKKNDVSDMFGYIALLLIENNWLDFNDLLD